MTEVLSRKRAAVCDGDDVSPAKQAELSICVEKQPNEGSCLVQASDPAQVEDGRTYSDDAPISAAQLRPQVVDVLGKPYSEWTTEQRERIIKLMEGRRISMVGASAEDSAICLQFSEELSAHCQEHDDLHAALDPCLVVFTVPAGQSMPRGWTARVQQAMALPPVGPSYVNAQQLAASETTFIVSHRNMPSGIIKNRDVAAGIQFGQFVCSAFPGAGIEFHLFDFTHFATFQ